MSNIAAPNPPPFVDFKPGNEAVGDLTSDKVGSGARFNAGKLPVSLIPQRLVAAQYRQALGVRGSTYHFILALEQMGIWQEGGGPDNLHMAMGLLGSVRDVTAACARVFDYGRKKYAAWNWAKGMPWSVCFECTCRHLYDLIEGQTEDHESHLPLIGHVACNIVMLLTYHRTYTQGDDRTPYLRDPPSP